MLHGMNVQYGIRPQTAEGQQRIAAGVQRQAFETGPYVPLRRLRPGIAHRWELRGFAGGFAIF